MTDIWTNRWQWPLILDEDEHEFFVPAFNRIGRHLFGETWRDDSGGLLPPPVRSDSPTTADEKERERAHTLLSEFWEGYVPNYQAAAQAVFQLGQLAGLGANAATPPVSTGYQFSADDWSRYRQITDLMDRRDNAERALVWQAAQWLLKRIASGEIVPLIQHRQLGGPYLPTTIDEWRISMPQRLMGRIASAALKPGMPNVPNGEFWIFFRRAEIGAAILADRPPLPAIEAEVTLDAVPEVETKDPQAQFARLAPEIRQFAREYILTHKAATVRDELIELLCARYTFMAPHMARRKVWDKIAGDFPSEWKLRQRGRKPARH